MGLLALFTKKAQVATMPFTFYRTGNARVEKTAEGLVVSVPVNIDDASGHRVASDTVTFTLATALLDTPELLEGSINTQFDAEGAALVKKWEEQKSTEATFNAIMAAREA